MSKTIRLLNAALDEEEGSEIVLRGRLDPSSLENIQVDTYQREIAPLVSLKKLIQAFERGSSVPDIDLGMRGQRCEEKGNVFTLKDDTFVVDGLQRITAACHVMRTKGISPRLGATVHFGTSEPWERERFEKLNAHRTKVSPNILIRNNRHDSSAVDMLFQLTHDPSFALHDRVSWSQKIGPHELITALTFLRTIGYLHSHLGSLRFSKAEDMVNATQNLMERIGKNVLRDNVSALFETVDRCWGIQRVTTRAGAPYMRFTFLTALVSVFSDHTDFWNENKFYVEASLVRKLQGFPIMTDPHVINLSGSGGKATDILYDLLVRHINQGKRTRRLTSRTGISPRVNKPLDMTEVETLEEEAA